MQIGVGAGDVLTYPLSGLNILDWRNPDRTHNNIPPSYNVLVRYKEKTTTKRSISMIDSESICQRRRESDQDKYEVDLIQHTDKYGHNFSVESQYESNFVDELDKYVDEHLTEHDYILRIETTNGMELKKQTIDMLASIFSDISAHELGDQKSDGSVVGMDEILEEILDIELLQVNEFINWK